MKTALALFLFAISLVFALHGQEVVLEPSFVKTQAINQRTTALQLVWLPDTLTLPFIDDFSSNNLLPVNSSQNDSNYVSLTQWKYFDLGTGLPIASNSFSLDTSFTTVINSGDTTITANQVVDTLLIHDHENYPSKIVDTVHVWNNYNLLDSSNSGVFDTLWVDTLLNQSTKFGLVPPLNNLWEDHQVFINSNYAIDLPSIGVATFDAVDYYGAVYSHGGTKVFPADSLTSKAINLAGLSATDNIYLSFMIEPGGIGDVPEDGDNLTLEFKDKNNNWIDIWSSANETDLTSTSFKNISIALTDENYLHPAFQFRFVNYASLSNQGQGWQSNSDQWHLDYVLLDKNRSASDNYLQDVCFKTLPTALLNNYYSVPWSHYKSNTKVTASTCNMNVGNNSSSAVNNNYQSHVFENGTSIHFNSSAGAASLSAGESKIFSPSFTGFTFTSSESYYTLFNLQHVVSSDLNTDLIPGNDTVSFMQVFDQHYAYDDGSAEAGYGLNAFEGKFALQYELLSTTEKLTAIDVYFNNTLTQANFDVPISLTIWDNNNGKPGNILAQTISQFPKKSDSLNTFLSYKLDDPISVSGTIYVGWEQLSTELVNVGLDKNTDSKSKMFYNVNGFWQNSKVNGTVMIRPHFGTNRFLAANVPVSASILLHPNPVRDILEVKGMMQSDVLFLLDIQGKIILQTKSNVLHVSHLKPGTYFVEVIKNDGQQIKVQKFIKI